MHFSAIPYIYNTYVNIFSIHIVNKITSIYILFRCEIINNYYYYNYLYYNSATINYLRIRLMTEILNDIKNI